MTTVVPPPGPVSQCPSHPPLSQSDAGYSVRRGRPGQSGQNCADTLGQVLVGGLQTRTRHSQEQQQGRETLPGHGTARLVYTT